MLFLKGLSSQKVTNRLGLCGRLFASRDKRFSSTRLASRTFCGKIKRTRARDRLPEGAVLRLKGVLFLDQYGRMENCRAERLFTINFLGKIENRNRKRQRP
jgi:hypothetical protein